MFPSYWKPSGIYGTVAKKLRKDDPLAMHKAHDLWDETLKKMSEENKKGYTLNATDQISPQNKNKVERE